MDNIGASGAWWPNDLVNFAPSVQQNVANLLFSGSGLALSAYRYNIGGGGTAVTTPARAPQTFRTSSGAYDWNRDPGGRLFLQYAAQAGVPDLIGFVNSAPSVWTSNGQSCGGTLVSGSTQAYATYLADIAAHFDGLGQHLDYLSPMNEPTNSFSGCGQEGMLVPVAQRDDVVRTVGATLASRGLTTAISADESSAVSGFNSEVPQWIGQSGTAQYVSNLAHHTYDNPNDAARTAAMNVGRTNGKKTWASEICCFTGIGGGWAQGYDPTITGGLAISEKIFRDFSVTYDSAFHWWVALASGIGCDPVASPGCQNSANSSGWSDGLIYYDPNYASNGNQSLYLTKRYYALGQYSKFVRPGAVRYNVTGAPSGVQVSAFDHNGQWTLVVNNVNTASTSLTVHFNAKSNVSAGSAYRTSATENWASVAGPTVSGSTVSATLPARSITTYVLNQTGGGSSSITSPLTGVASGKCLEVPGGATANSTQTAIYTCNGGTNQSWTYTAASELRVYGNKCLEAYQQGTADGTRAVIYDCNGGVNQRWRTNANGQLVGEQSGKCVDVTGASTANGALLILWTCHGGTNQAWQRP
ncbi:glycoside hydrolase [Phytohabitans rumicis]|uniref:glycoside hydrolase n=1 Tax=Phytohabitans rumicis TaxID=1076125 RepID=UPI0024844DAE|nr:glycoside hydrolase [Phytohabitans rumicis]